MLLAYVGILVSLVSGESFPRHYIGISDEEALSRAKAALQRYPLVDGHNDLAWRFRQRLSNQIGMLDLTTDVNTQWGPSHTDIPRLRAGQVGGQFWAAYVDCRGNENDGVRATLEQIDVIKRFVAQYPDTFQFVTTYQGIEEAFAAGKIGGLISVEGGHGVDSSFAALRMLYEVGTRMMTLTHSCTLPWADSSTADDTTDDPKNWGLSDFGKDMVNEMNRLGIIIDVSHVSKRTQLDAIEHSRAPVVFSHSNVWQLCHRTRNAHDDVIRKLAEKGGVIMITFVGAFLDNYPGNYTVANLQMVADHIDYVRNLVGVHHVGIGGDYDGMSRPALGLEDVSKYPDLFAELVKRGWSDYDLELVAGRNIVRVFKEVETWTRDEFVMLGARPKDAWIAESELQASECRSTG